MSDKDMSQMNVAELDAHIRGLDAAHHKKLKSIRAYYKIKRSDDPAGAEAVDKASCERDAADEKAAAERKAKRKADKAAKAPAAAPAAPAAPAAAGKK